MPCLAEVLLKRSRFSPSREKPPRVLLLDGVKQEVQAGRSQSLHRAVWLHLKREKPPQQLQRSWDIDIKIGNRPSVQVPPTASIAQLFDRTGGKLVILGAEGAGKTTMLLNLAGKLASRAQRDASLPMPVLFNLSSWKDDSQAIADWLVAQLQLKYGISAEIGQQWVAQQQLLPLLDGWNEVATERQDRCIQAINQFLEGASPPKNVVVCSSFEAYKNCQKRLRLPVTILLKPLTETQIRDYLLEARSRELWYSIQNDPDLLKLAKTPLLLTMMTLGYEEILIQSWKRLNSVEERREYLFNAFIRRQLVRDIQQQFYPQGKEPRPESIRHWLALDKLSPSWLQTPQQQQMYQTASQVVTGIIFGLTVGVIVGFIGGWLWGIISALIAGASGMFVRISVIENWVLRWVLWRQGYIPWNYRRFLNYASERLLLQRVDKRYRFIHDLLREHFAQMR